MRAAYLLNIENTQVDKGALLGVVDLRPLDDDGVGWEVNPPGKGSRADKHLSQRAKAERGQTSLPASSCTAETHFDQLFGEVLLHKVTIRAHHSSVVAGKPLQEELFQLLVAGKLHSFSGAVEFIIIAAIKRRAVPLPTGRGRESSSSGGEPREETALLLSELRQPGAGSDGGIASMNEDHHLLPVQDILQNLNEGREQPEGGFDSFTSSLPCQNISHPSHSDTRIGFSL